jgi:hypothetical protein
MPESDMADWSPQFRPLGRNTEDTMRHAEHWMSVIAPAPEYFAGMAARAQVSPPIYRYCPGGFDNQWIGMCFPAGTPIRMANGEEKPIEDVTPGDRVVTHISGSRAVVNAFSRRYTGELINVEASRFRFPLRATADHSFAVRNGDGIRWVRAADLQIGDELLLGSLAPDDAIQSLDLLAYLPGGYSDHDLMARRAVPLSRPAVSRAQLRRSGFYSDTVERIRLAGVRYASGVIRHLAVTESLARLVGLYLAEGSTDLPGCRVSWTLNQAEGQLADEIVQLVRGCFGVEAAHHFANDGQATRYVRVDNKVFATIWSNLVPGEVDTKRVPGFLMAAPAHVRRALLAGWLAGDGHNRIREDGEFKAVVISGTSTSSGLARDITTLALGLDLRATANPRTAHENRRQAYDVSFSGREAQAIIPGLAEAAAAAGITTQESERFLCRFGRTAPIRQLTCVAVVDLPVYDFEVEEDHSFVAGGIVVHNCVGKGTKNAVSTLLRIPKDATWDPQTPDQVPDRGPNIRLSGLYCYWNARNTHGRSGFGEGAVVAYSLDGLLKYGFVTEELYPDTHANQTAYSDRNAPSQKMRDFGSTHRIQESHAARITSRDQFLDFMAAGFPVVLGVPIGQGWMNTAEDGKFSLGGRTVGGHCTVAVGYDQKLNRLYDRNSWFGWGAVTDDPEFNSEDPALGGNAKGRSNIGYCSLDEFLDRHFTERALSSGETDAFVLNDVPWDGRDQPVEPKIKMISTRILF